MDRALDEIVAERHVNTMQQPTQIVLTWSSGRVTEVEDHLQQVHHNHVGTTIQAILVMA